MNMIETLATKPTTKNGLELDAIEHRDALVWRKGEIRKVKRSINRRFRREARQLLRTALI